MDGIHTGLPAGFSSEMLVMRRLRMTRAGIFPATDRREMSWKLPQSVLLPLFLNRETNVVLLTSLDASSSSQMLVRSDWSASRTTGQADLKIPEGIPSIPGDFSELVCLVAFETSSIVGRGGGGGVEVEAGDHGFLLDVVEHSGVHSGRAGY